MKLFVSLLLFATGLPIGMAKPPVRRAVFYEITKPGTTDTSYLFGTLHLLESTYVDTMPRVMSALRRADVVAGEIVLDSAISDIAGQLLSGPSLDKVLSKKEYQLVGKAVMRIAHMPMMFLNQMPPSMIFGLLMLGVYHNAHPENHVSGVELDLFFQQEGKKLGKKVVGLESAKYQESLLSDSIPIKEQVHWLMDLIRNEKKSIKLIDRMLDLYESGEVEALMKSSEFGELSAAMDESLIDDRNRKWLAELPALLDHKRVFIAVGAGHLVGEDGLVIGLTKLGYKVTSNE